MSPLTRLHRQLTIVAVAAALAASVAVGFVAGQLASPDPVSPTDLIPSGVNSCVTAIKASLTLLDPDSIVTFDRSEQAELRVLPARCNEPSIHASIEADYPALLARLETIGTNGR